MTESFTLQSVWLYQRSLHCGDELGHVDHSERRELDVEVRGVGSRCHGVFRSMVADWHAQRAGGNRKGSYSPRLSASFSIFWNTSAGLSPEREYSCRRLISAMAASRSSGVGYQCRRCHSGPRSLRNGIPGRKAHADPVGTQLLDRRGAQVLRLTDAHRGESLRCAARAPASRRELTYRAPDGAPSLESGRARPHTYGS